jgi:hypothetical protein
MSGAVECEMLGSRQVASAAKTIEFIREPLCV